MDNPLQVCVGTMDLAAVHSVTQHVEIIAEEDKRQRVTLLKTCAYNNTTILLFLVVGFHSKPGAR
jgi:hypothetical protein